jgi:hypothetical protein
MMNVPIQFNNRFVFDWIPTVRFLFLVFLFEIRKKKFFFSSWTKNRKFSRELEWQMEKKTHLFFTYQIKQLENNLVPSLYYSNSLNYQQDNF